jgi:hypothetical protein
MPALDAGTLTAAPSSPGRVALTLAGTAGGTPPYSYSLERAAYDDAMAPAPALGPGPPWDVPAPAAGPGRPRAAVADSVGATARSNVVKGESLSPTYVVADDGGAYTVNSAVDGTAVAVAGSSLTLAAGGSVRPVVPIAQAERHGQSIGWAGLWASGAGTTVLVEGGSAVGGGAGLGAGAEVRDGATISMTSGSLAGGDDPYAPGVGLFVGDDASPCTISGGVVVGGGRLPGDTGAAHGGIGLLFRGTDLLIEGGSVSPGSGTPGTGWFDAATAMVLRGTGAVTLAGGSHSGQIHVMVDRGGTVEFQGSGLSWTPSAPPEGAYDPPARGADEYGTVAGTLASGEAISVVVRAVTPVSIAVASDGTSVTFSPP